MLQPTTIPTIRAAVERLTSLQRGMEEVEDFSGFNNADLSLGKALSGGGWTEIVKGHVELAAVARMLLCYRNTQLGDHEVEAALDAIEHLKTIEADSTSEARIKARRADIGTAAKDFHDRRKAEQVARERAEKERQERAVKVTWTGKSAVVAFEYDAQLVAVLKDTFQFSTRRWDAVDRRWVVTGAAASAWKTFADAMAAAGREMLVQGEPVYGPEPEQAKTPGTHRLLVSVHDDGVRFVFDYGTSVFFDVKDVMSLCGGRFNKRTGSDSYWTIRKGEFATAADRLRTIHGVDLSSLEAVALVLAGDAQAKADAAAKMQVRWPSTVKPFAHQEAGARFLATRDTCLLADDMGLGKTLQALIAWENTAQLGDRALVLCPASLTRNWAIEVRKWIPKTSVGIIDGHVPHAQIVVASYDTVKPKGLKHAKYTDDDATKARVKAHNAKVLAEPRNALYREITAIPWNLNICDEAHRLKNQQSARHALAKGVQTRRRWLLTGTPILNRPMDLFALLHLCGHELGQNRHKFGLQYCNATNNGYGWDYNGCSNAAELGEKLSAWLMRRVKEDCLDLPPKMRTEQACTVPESMRRYEFTTIGDMMAARAKLGVAKTAATWERVEDIIEAGEKVIVFSEYLDVLNELQALATDAKIGFARIDGSVPAAKRQAAVEAFQTNPNVQIFLGQTIAASEGITLTAATQVIFNDLSLVPAYHWQAEDRAYRIGQKKSVTVCYMLAEAVLDEILWEILQVKRETIASIENGLLDSTVAVQSNAKALFDALKKLTAKDRTPSPNAPAAATVQTAFAMPAAPVRR